MPTHTTPPPHADQTDQTAEPARRASRFDERGIALQTIIIMVVLLAIAGSVAAVLLNRAGEETANLEDSVSSTAYGITNAQGCQIGGHTWVPDATGGNAPSTTELELLQNARPGETGANGWCKP